jgi:hypothetical protein
MFLDINGGDLVITERNGIEKIQANLLFSNSQFVFVNLQASPSLSVKIPNELILATTIDARDVPSRPSLGRELLRGHIRLLSYIFGKDALPPHLVEYL